MKKQHKAPFAKIKRDFLNKLDEVFGTLPWSLPPCVFGDNNRCSECQLCVNIQLWDERNNPTCIICGNLIDSPYTKTEYCITCEEVIQYNITMHRLFDQELTTPEREYMYNHMKEFTKLQS